MTATTTRPVITFGKVYVVEPGLKEWEIFRDGKPAGFFTSQHETARLYTGRGWARREVTKMKFVAVDVCLWDRPEDAQDEASFTNLDGYDAAAAIRAAKAWAKAQLSA